MFSKDQINWEKVNGLVPVVVQDGLTLEVLMLAYMNPEALEKTLAESRLTFFSRSKNRLWTKGETSGNYLNLVNLSLDCDGDTIVAKVIPQGPACHRNTRSCFGDDTQSMGLGFLGALQKVIKSRKETKKEGSYTASLFEKGLAKIAQKVGEEAVETVIAAMNRDKQEYLNESSDLLFHLLVLNEQMGLGIEQILERLESRHK